MQLPQSVQSKPWFLPVVIGILVVSLGWSAVYVARAFGGSYSDPVLPNGPMDLLGREITAKLQAIESFRHLEAAPDPENPQGILIGGVLLEDDHAYDLEDWAQEQKFEAPVRLVAEGPTVKLGQGPPE